MDSEFKLRADLIRGAETRQFQQMEVALINNTDLIVAVEHSTDGRGVVINVIEGDNGSDVTALDVHDASNNADQESEMNRSNYAGHVPPRAIPQPRALDKADPRRFDAGETSGSSDSQAELLYALAVLEFAAKEGRKNIVGAGPDMTGAIFDSLETRIVAVQKAVAKCLGIVSPDETAGDQCQSERHTGS